MSGHSHWKKVKYKKGATDAKKSKMFSKLSRMISVAAQEKGGDPSTNNKLKIAIDTAKSFNLPKDTIERAIKKGTGELEGTKLEEVLFEAYGPQKTALIIEGITDNKNRTFSDIKQVLFQYNGKLAETGSVQWLFDRKGVITVNVTDQKKEDIELIAIEAGVDDIAWNDGEVDLYTKAEDLEKVRKNLEEKNLKIESSSLDWVAKQNIKVENTESVEKLFEALDEVDEVQEIYSNFKMP
ncbi:YebC/PmpR family DNA-binding transcriptional regulator [Patescibacteria group bacterium]